MNTFSVCIGYDPRQPVAFNTLANSIWRYASKPIPIVRLDLKTLPMKRRGLTEFTYSRFLVPWLAKFDGLSLFLDSDIICLADVVELLAYPMLDPGAAVYVVKNERRFEWPSVMLFNNALCTELTPQYVDDSENALFDFKWANRIGELPSEWNHLANYDAPRKDAKMVHFTQGIPCWRETKDSEYAAQWIEGFNHARTTVSFEALMGNSVHADPVYKRLKEKRAANG